ncbi:MAG: D-alanyl-D-alanine carboxypeptidase/D-alanyl-D-alanine-endopeptidase [Bdellovibrionales bacterium]|nr:D-alanyl-D-alanine carboxypeptidase/D-alanyl-D-alanine-endopeptidase [Bdellovibrionales bacterium]
MRKSLSKPLLLTLLAAPFASASEMSMEEFQNQMKRHVRNLPKQAAVSFHAEVLGTGQAVFSHDMARSLVPASNAKLFTSMAALEKLGPAHQFETQVYAEGKRDGDVLDGFLVVKGTGDPFLVSERVWLLAREMARSGIKRVTGGIRVNNTVFAEEYRGLVGWGEKGEPFAALVNATSLNFNSLEVHVRIKSGRAHVELGPVPHDFAVLRNELRVVAGRGRDVAVRPVGAERGKEIFAVVGTVGREAEPFIEYGAVGNSAAYVGAVLAAVLRREGMVVEKGFTGLHAEEPKGELLATAKSPPLLDLVRSFNTYSNNFMAEQVFLSLGSVPATPEKAQEFVRTYLQNLPGCPDADIDAGSGLSFSSRASAQCFVSALQRSHREFRVFADLLGSMPVGGKTGTLKGRFLRNGSGFEAQKVRAKTGTLFSRRAVTSLVGFTPTASGETVVFAILQNDERSGSGFVSPMRDWEDKCVEYLQRLRL